MCCDAIINLLDCCIHVCYAVHLWYYRMALLAAARMQLSFEHAIARNASSSQTCQQVHVSQTVPPKPRTHEPSRHLHQRPSVLVGHYQMGSNVGHCRSSDRLWRQRSAMQRNAYTHASSVCQSANCRNGPWKRYHHDEFHHQCSQHSSLYDRVPCLQSATNAARKLAAIGLSCEARSSSPGGGVLNRNISSQP